MISAKRIEEMAANPEREYNDVPPVKFGEKDDFDREIIADNIIKLLDSDLTDCYPMAIDGGWGTGKSEFCHKLINKLRDNAANYKPRNIIYFDAFEAENVEEPLLSLLAKITEVVPEDERKSVISKIAPVALYAGKVIGKGVLSHLFKQDGDTIWNDIKRCFCKEGQTNIDKAFDKLLKQYSQAKNNINALTCAIKNALKEKELVIFIDELDRCRPDFALNVFEIVKHIFDIEGVKFIFVFNSRQINSMIKNRYGDDIETERYMEKFIHEFISLSPKSSYYAKSEISNSIKLLMEYGIKNRIGIISGKDAYFNMIIENIFINNEITLRKANEIIKNIKIYRTLKSDNHINLGEYDVYIYIELIAIFIFSIRKDIVKNSMKNQISWRDVLSFIGTPKLKKYESLHIFVTACMQQGDNFKLETFHQNEYQYMFEHYLLQLFKNKAHIDGTAVFYNTIKTLNFCG